MRTLLVPLKLISLQDDGFHLLVEIVVFGETHLAVLDTGASRSVFDKALLERHLPEGLAVVEENTDENYATTLFSTSSTLTATLPVLKLGRLKLKDYPAVGLDLQSVNASYQQMGHPVIAAIIGGDILVRYQAVINYKKLHLKLHK